MLKLTGIILISFAVLSCTNQMTPETSQMAASSVSFYQDNSAKTSSVFLGNES